MREDNHFVAIIGQDQSLYGVLQSGESLIPYLSSNLDDEINVVTC